MSVYIKGMEMPTVRDTLVLVKTNGKAIVYEDKAYATTAVPVPPHGRLIDADALLKHKGNCYDADGHLLYAVGTGNILCAPTIIPADPAEGGEG